MIIPNYVVFTGDFLDNAHHLCSVRAESTIAKYILANLLMQEATRLANVCLEPHLGQYSILTLLACPISHLQPLPFNPAKESAKVQQGASPNRRGTLPSPVMLIGLNDKHGHGQQSTYRIDPYSR
jgi:hypothetical protein